MTHVVRARWRTVACSMLLVLAFAGCGEDDSLAPSAPSIAGRWSGSALAGTVRFEATFTQSGETVGGSGQVNSIYGSDHFTISGTLRGQEVLLTLTSTQNGVSGYTGKFTGANTIEGRLDPPDLALKIERDD